MKATIRLSLTAACLTVAAMCSAAGTALADPVCTETWTGAAGDSAWTTPANWSGAAVPTGTDAVCLPAGATVTVSSAGATAASIQGDGATLKVESGSLTVAAGSVVGSLTVDGGTLNTSDVAVTGSFTWTGGTMTGAGTTTLATGATGTITSTAGADPLVLDGHSLVNEGTLTFDCSQSTDPDGVDGLITGDNGAELANDATMAITTNGSGSGCEFRQGSGAPATLSNTGTLQLADWTYSPVGWQLASTDSAVITTPDGSSLALYGGTAQSNPIGGDWQANVGLLLEAGGSYTFTQGATVSGYVNVDADPADQWDGAADYAQWLAGNTDAPSLSLGDVDWPQAAIDSAGVTRIGDGSSAAILGTLGSFEDSPNQPPPKVDLYEPSSVAGAQSPWITNELIAYQTKLTVHGDLYLGDNLVWLESQEDGGQLTIDGDVSGDGDGVAAFVNTLDDGSVVINGDFLGGTGSVIDAYGGDVVLNGAADTWGHAEIEPDTDTPGDRASLDVAGTAQALTLGLHDATWSGQGATILSNYDGSTGGSFQATDGSLITGQTILVNGPAGTYPDGSSVQFTGRVLGADGATVAVGPSTKFAFPDGASAVAGPSPAAPTIETDGGQLVNESATATYIGWNFVDDTASNGYGRQLNPPGGAFTPYAGFDFAGTTSGVGFGGGGGSVPSSSEYGGQNAALPNRLVSLCYDPVDCATGDQTEQQTDLTVYGRGGALGLTRTYNSQLAASQGTPSQFGYGWTGPADTRLWVDQANSTATVQQANGSTVSFAANSDGSFSPGPGVEATLAQNSDGSYAYTEPSGSVLAFSHDGRLLSSMTRTGLATSYTYNSADQMTSITAPSGRTLRLTYNDAGLVATAADPNGDVVSYAYDAADNLTEVDQADASAPTRWQFGYDDAHELTLMTDAAGHTSHITYNALRVASQTDAMSHTVTWSYGTGTTTITAPNGRVTKEQFDSNGDPTAITRAYGSPQQTTEAITYNTAMEPLQVTDGDGHSTTYTYNAAGDRTSQTDADSRETQWSYDGHHEIVSMTLPSGEVTTYGYNTSNQLVSITRTAAGGSTPSQTSTFDYTADGDLHSSTNPLDHTTDYGYDSAGDVTSTTDPAGAKTTYAYDSDGQVTSKVAPDGNQNGGTPAAHTTTYAYDPLGDVVTTTDPLGHTTTVTYDADRKVSTVTDPAGNTTQYAYDADEQLTTTTRPDGTTQTNGYDANGNVTTQSNGAGKTTTYAYDPLNELVAVTDPLNHTTQYGYDNAGNRTTVTDPAGRITTFAFDHANQVQSISYSDANTPGVSFGYTPDGLRDSMTDGTGTTSYHYDGLDRLTSETNGAGNTVAYDYDAGNDVTKITYPNDQTITRAFDDAGRLTSVTDWNNNTTAFAYDPDGNLTTTTYPSTTADVDTYGYDATDAMTSAMMTRGLDTLASLTYSRNARGLIASESQTGLPGAGNTTYAYNSLDQLTSAGADAYTYDSADNPTQLGASTDLQYDDANELTSDPGGNYSYDDMGQRTNSPDSGSGPATYSYNQAGELTSATVENGTTTYSYTGDGLQAATSSSGNSTPLSWDEASGSLPTLLSEGGTSYVDGPGGLPTEQITASGETTYLHHDQLGSTRLITNSAGAVTGAFTYTPYGQVAANTGTATTTMGYAGQYTDAQSGLQYLRSRYYDPQTGQFLSRDPLESLTAQPYSYGSDDPINSRDPSGLWLGISWLPSPGQAASAVGQVVAGAANAVAPVAAAVGGAAASAGGLVSAACNVGILVPVADEPCAIVKGVTLAAGATATAADGYLAATGQGPAFTVPLDVLSLAAGPAGNALGSLLDDEHDVAALLEAYGWSAGSLGYAAGTTYELACG